MIKIEESMRIVRKEERMMRKEIVEEFDRMVELELRGVMDMRHRPLGSIRSRSELDTLGGYVEAFPGAKGTKSWHHWHKGVIFCRDELNDIGMNESLSNLTTRNIGLDI
jgi:hypothetical protein